MNLNLEFLVVAYFISLFVDWIFQWDWQAVNKSKWNFNDNWRHSFFALGTHSFVYAILTSGLLSSLGIITVVQGFLVFLVLLVTHLIIDTRIPVKWIMRWKGMTDKQINYFQNYGFMHIGIDHRLHELVLLILAFIVK